MPRPSTAKQRRKELLPQVTDVFCELGYRGATTAEIAARCGVQETILYRLWEDKKAMFVAAIDYLYEFRTERIESALERVPDNEDPIEYLIDDVARDLGGHGLQRIIYAALGELSDPKIRNALRRLYRDDRALILGLLARSEGERRPPAPALEKDVPWVIMGLVYMMDLTCELELLGPRQRAEVFKRAARALVGLGGDR